MRPTVFYCQFGSRFYGPERSSYLGVLVCSGSEGASNIGLVVKQDGFYWMAA
jgi:hypothetical protein